VRGGPHSGGSDGWAAAVVSRSAEDRRSERRRRRRRWYLQLGRRGTGGRERRQRIGARLAGHGGAWCGLDSEVALAANDARGGVCRLRLKAIAAAAVVRPVGGGGRSRERLCSARVHGGRAPRHGAERSKETTRGRRRMERAGGRARAFKASEHGAVARMRASARPRGSGLLCSVGHDEYQFEINSGAGNTTTKIH